MPLYEYSCRDCGHRFEMLQRMGEGAEGLACPRCGAAALAKQFSSFAGVVAGGGTASAAGAAGGGCGAAACGSGGFT